MAEYAGYRTKLEVEIASVYTVVAQIRDLSGPEAESDQIEVSHRGNAGAIDRWRRYVAGLADGGEVSFDVVFDPDHASHDPTVSGSMWDLLETGEVNSFRITFPGAGSDITTATFDAFVSGFAINSPLEDGITADLTLKITGAVTWAHA